LSFREQFQMKSGLTIIAALLLMLQSGGTHAANLKYVRTANHQDFTRIVFEFQNETQFKEPVIHGKGNFSVAFYDSTTVLPRQILYKTTQIQPVRSIEFTQKETLLTAVIKLPFSDFNLKVFSLSDPNRVVIDAYKTIPPPRESVPEESLHAKPMAKESKEPETKDPKAVPEESPAKELNRVVKKEPEVIRDKFPATQTGENYTLQTYMLVLLNFLTVVIVLLLSFNLLKKKSGMNSKHGGKISDAVKTGDERIAAIDTMINRELKKHDFR
jgi:hypothetical protein